MHKVLITSQGRTATLSLHKALQTLPKVSSHHERQRTDVSFLFYSQMPEFHKLTKDYLASEDDFANRSDGDHYVAINPYFRFAGESLKSHFGWQVAHLVRHPKTYLESVYPRRIFTEFDSGLHQLPQGADPYQEEWNVATRFEKLCWYYAKTLSFFKASQITWYRYEDIISSAAALNAMLQDLGLPLFANDFKLPIHNKKNSLKNKIVQFKNPKFRPSSLVWQELSTKELDTYHRFFGPLSEHFGYDL